MGEREGICVQLLVVWLVRYSFLLRRLLGYGDDCDPGADGLLSF